MKRFLLLFLILYSVSSVAQTQVSGIVKDSVSNESLSSVNVFLQNASHHAQTAVNGGFLLNNVKPGRYTLIASAVGYERYTVAIAIGEKTANISIKLKPQLTQLNEVVISRLSDKRREDLYRKFFASFIGTSAHAAKCTILNPNCLRINYDDENYLLRVSSDSLLVVRNQALGYEVKILLDQFTLNLASNLVTYKGNLYFEDLKGTAADVRRWEKARAQTYSGSIKHFYKSLYQKTLNKDGFTVHPISTELDSLRPQQAIIESKIKQFKNGNKDSLSYWQKQYNLPEFRHQILRKISLKEADLVRTAAEPGLFEITFDKHLYLISKNKVEQKGNSFNPTTTILTLQSDKAFFDLNGVLVGKSAIVYEGENMERIADLLPYDYALTKEVVINTATQLSSSRIQQSTQPSSKIYLHTDRETYVAGDDIWYSIYQIRPAHQKDTINYNLYVELISAQNTLMSRQVINLKNGIGAGDIKLADSIKLGKYWLRAYISPKQNQGNYSIFEKQITIMGLNEGDLPSLNTKIREETKWPIIQFFPEGGKLVNGISTHIAYKVTQTSPQYLKGFIVNSRGDTVTAINPDITGMGSFILLPLTGNQYWFKGVDKEKKPVIMQLPTVLEKGISFFIKDTDSLLNVFISCDEKTVQEMRNENLKLTIKHQGEIISSNDILLKSNQFLLKIDKQVLLPGINQISLLNKKGTIHCERLVFAYPKESAIVKLKNEQQANKDISIQIMIEDLKGKPLKGSFSVSIVDGSLVDESITDIQSQTLLQADLKARVENINNYFVASNKNRFKEMNLLMLTQDKANNGWKFTDTLKPQISLPLEQGIKLAGKVIDERKKTPINQANVTVRIPKAGGVKIFSDLTDSLGQFSVPNLSLYGIQDVIVTSKNAKGEPWGKIVLDSILKDTLAINYKQEQFENHSYANIKDSVLIARKKAYVASGVQLKTVEINGKKKISLVNGIVMDGGYPSENFNIRSKDNEFQDVRHYLLTNSRYAVQESSRIIYVCNGKHENCAHEPISQRYPGYCTCDTENPLQKILTEDLNRVMFMSDGLQIMPKLFVNGREVVWDEIRDTATAAMMYNEFLAIRIDKFESIEIKKVLIVPTLAPSATVAPGYLLYLNTKPGIMLNSNSERVVTTFNAYYRSRTFGSGSNENDFKIDYKPTLYWNPNVNTDENGNAIINFRPSKPSTKVFIRIEGLSEDGNIINASSSFITSQ
jgi:hypothetical protein